MATYLHGVEVISAPDGARPIGLPAATAIGLVGTSVDVAHEDLHLVEGIRAARARYPGGGTILPALEAIYSQGAAPPVAVVNALDPATDVTAVADEAHAWVAVDAIIQLANKNVTLVAITDAGAAVNAADYAVDAAAGTVTVKSIANTAVADAVLISYSFVDTAAVTPAEAVAAASRLIDAQGALGVLPEILIAPAFTEAVALSGAGAIDGVPGTAGLAAVAERLRGLVVADGPGTTRAAALAYRAVIDSRRVLVVDPKVRVASADGTVSDAPASAYVAGLIARSDRDAERGWWVSPSNQALLGIVGTSRPVSFMLGDTDSEANALNEAHVSTVIRQDGWRLWGGRTCSSDPKWQFVSVVRTFDRVSRALLEAHLWAVDRNIRATYVSGVVESVNSFLRDLVRDGAILGGTCWADRELNTDTSVAGGRIYFDFEFTPAYPAERITFRARITGRYVETIF